MPGYAIAQLYDVDLNAEIVEYLERIDSTLAPFGGSFSSTAGAAGDRGARERSGHCHRIP